MECRFDVIKKKKQGAQASLKEGSGKGLKGEQKLDEEGLMPLGHREHNSTCASPEALKGGLYN